MSPSDASRPSAGQRSLAAIVFSDALGFSARMTEDEERAQEHAEPGGICMSQTVYEVVRNSLSVPVEGPESLELKNIERVQALRIGPRDLWRHAPKRRRTSGSWKGIGYARARRDPDLRAGPLSAAEAFLEIMNPRTLRTPRTPRTSSCRHAD